MYQQYHLTADLPVVDKVDVLVVGGGTAGTFAAISAGMQGARTLLIEKNGKLGGTVTSAGVNFPGLFHAWGEQIIAGPCWESVSRAVSFDNLELPKFDRFPKDHWLQQIDINPFTYAAVLDRMAEEAHVTTILHTMVSYAEEEADGVTVLCTSKEGLWAVKTKILIDATGDANITGMLGYPRVRSEVLQPATLMNDLGGYDLSQMEELAFSRLVKEAVGNGILEETDMQGGNLYHQLARYRISMHIPEVDASTSHGKTMAEIKARKTLMKIVRFLKTVPGLETLHVVHAAEECGIRETCRIVGEATITSEAYLSGHVYDDAVCYAFYPIDLHIPNGIKQIFLEEGIVPTIPYKAMIPKGAKRLLVAGRCISGDTDSNSATRVQAPCMATGQAAGIAAALAAATETPVPDVSFDVLRSRLEAIGAIVPYKGRRF